MKRCLLGTVVVIVVVVAVVVVVVMAAEGRDRAVWPESRRRNLHLRQTEVEGRLRANMKYDFFPFLLF